MSLEHLFRKELKSREESVEWASNKVYELMNGHISKDEDGIDHFNYDSFDEQKKDEFDYQSRYKDDCCLRLQLLKEYVREYSGLKFDDVFKVPTEKLISNLVAEETNGYLLSDVVNIKTNEKFAVIMGQQFSNKVFEGKSPEEIKEIYFTMITQSMVKNGFTQEQIDECVNNIAVSMGGREKSSSLNM